jgi:hypothetical protein
MKCRTDLKVERLKKLLRYDAKTGVFTWIIYKAGTNPGGVCKRISEKGYVKIVVDGIIYLAHRLAWLYVHGAWPNEEIDHINGIRHDNRLCNLREASRSENAQNQGLHRNNTSGYPGVNFHKASRSWRAVIGISNTKRVLGYFRNKEDASAAYLQAKEEIHTFNPFVRGLANHKSVGGDSVAINYTPTEIVTQDGFNQIGLFPDLPKTKTQRKAA